MINQKTPTILLLDPRGKFHSFGFSARDFYHDLKEADAKRWMLFERFKMVLHHEKVRLIVMACCLLLILMLRLLAIVFAIAAAGTVTVLYAIALSRKSVSAPESRPPTEDPYRLWRCLHIQSGTSGIRRSGELSGLLGLLIACRNSKNGHVIRELSDAVGWKVQEDQVIRSLP